MCCMYTVYSGMQEWVIQIPSIPILVSVLFPSLHLKYFRIKFFVTSTYVHRMHAALVCVVLMNNNYNLSIIIVMITVAMFSNSVDDSDDICWGHVNGFQVQRQS